jgi:hypothetical protein
MQDGLVEVTRLGEADDHVRGLALVHGDHGDSVPDVWPLPWRHCSRGEAIGSGRRENTILRRQGGTGGVQAEHLAPAATINRGEEKVSHHLLVDRWLVDPVPNTS